jgi:hypothetical protein
MKPSSSLVRSLHETSMSSLKNLLRTFYDTSKALLEHLYIKPPNTSYKASMETFMTPL